MLTLEVCQWMYQHFLDSPIDDSCPISKEKLLIEIRRITERLLKQRKEHKELLMPLEQEVIDVLINTNPYNAMTAQEIWNASPVIQKERKLQGIAQLLSKMVKDGTIIKIPPQPQQNRNKYYINRNYKKD